MIYLLTNYQRKYFKTQNELQLIHCWFLFYKKTFKKIIMYKINLNIKLHLNNV